MERKLCRGSWKREEGLNVETLFAKSAAILRSRLALLLLLGASLLLCGGLLGRSFLRGLLLLLCRHPLPPPPFGRVRSSI